MSEPGGLPPHDKRIRAALARFERLARRMLGGLPTDHGLAGDVFQNAVESLVRTLEGSPVADDREFYNLAAAVIRRQLKDLARHPRGPVADPAAPDDLGRWSALHAAAERLPPVEREVFELVFYHGQSQKQIAVLLDVNERVVRHRWRQAVAALSTGLGGDFPGD